MFANVLTDQATRDPNKEYSDNMKFLIDPGFIEETGFQCNISTNERNLPHFDAPIRM